ncbi:restriction endonuclease subunit S [Vibrio parahaemolyticus]
MSWPLVSLSSIAEVVTGNTPSKADESFFGGEIPFVSPSELDQGYVSSSKQTLTVKGASVSRLIPAESVMVCCIGSLGKVGISSVPVVTNQQINSLVINQDIAYPLYVYYFCKTLKNTLNNMAPKTTVAIVNKTKFSALKIPLPPLETQKQIAAVLEKADQLRKDCVQIEQELNSLAQSVFIDMFGDPVTNPKGWVKQSLKSISSKFHDGPFGSNLKTSHYTDSGVQVIRLKNIGSGEFKEADKAFVSEAHAETLHKFKCYPGEIVIATLGEPNLRACIIPDSVPVAINKADCVHCVVDSSVINSHYLVEYLNLPSVLHTIQNKLHGQTRTRISSGQLATVDVVIPPLEQQAKYLEMLALRAKLKTDNNRLVHEYRELFNALIQKAFKGELDL